MKTKILLILLTGLFAVRIGNAQTVVGRQNVDQYPTTQWGGITYGLTWLPTDYSSTTEKYPLLIFLHGSGECGDGIPGLSKLISTGLPMHISKGWNAEAVNPVDGKNYKFIVVSPQAPAKSQWSYSYTHVRYILADVLKRYRIDTTRIYISGISAGGGGTWSSVTNDGNFTKRIAAIAPISATAVNNPATEGKNIPFIGGTHGVKVWAVIGGNDGHKSHNINDVNTINNATPKPEVPATYTLLPGLGHVSQAWNTAYNPTWRDNPFKLNVYEWLLQYHRGTGTPPPPPPPPANKPPVAKAGSDVSITLPIHTVTLDGSASADSDGNIQSFAWTRISGPASFSVANGNTAKPVFSNLQAGVHLFELTVTDNSGATAKDQVQVTVVAPPNKAPIAKAGSDHTIKLPLASVTLNGTGSSDPDGNIASFTWKKVAGPTSFSIETAAAAQTLVNGLIQGKYDFELTVTDNQGAQAKDTVSVMVEAAAPLPNQLPVAIAGSAQSITLPVNLVTLDAKNSYDADGSIVDYKWVKVAGPSVFSLATPLALKTLVTGLIQGTYIFELTVTDNRGGKDIDSITVTVNPLVVINKAPVANAGTDQQITLPTNSAALTGIGSTDADGNIATYLWKKISGPIQFSLLNANLVAAKAENLTEGTYTFELTVTDNNGASSKDTVVVKVLPAPPPPNKAPVAHAGNNTTITLPEDSVTLNGSLSADPDGSIVSYLWKKISGPASFFIRNENNAITTAGGLKAGIYVFELTVTDNKGASGKQTVTITVVKAPNKAPVAKAGNDTTYSNGPSTVDVNGSNSYDPDGNIVSYAWVKVSGPNPSTIINSSTSKAVLVNPIPGTYTIELTVTDNEGAAASDRVTIVVAAAPKNSAPVAVATDTIVLNHPDSTALLDGRSSYDPEGAPLTYTWRLLKGAPDVHLVSANAAFTWVKHLKPGTYTFELMVKDDKGATAKTEVVIVVKNAATRWGAGNQVSLFPNPVIRTFTIAINSSETGKSRIVIYNARGNHVYTRNFNKVQSTQQETIDATRFPSGLYLIMVYVEGAERKILRMLKL